MNSENVKGFRDIENAEKRNVIRNIIENKFQQYCFTPVETPIIEYAEFVKGTNQNDEAVSDVFTLKDKGERNLALRYEFTFQLKRLAQNKKLPYRRYQIGSLFRDEPIGPNRWRQFTQCDADIVGSNVKDEANLFNLIDEILGKLGIDAVINFNNRKLLNEILDEAKIKNKEEVIREIDKMDKLSEKEIEINLKKYRAEKLLDIFKKPRSYFKKYDSYKDVEALENECSLYKIKINFVPFLARGLSYYNGTIFEVKKKDFRGSLAAGGAYLINGIQSFGISFGLDRLELLAQITYDQKSVLIISLNQDKKSIELAEKIREKNVGCQIFYGKPGKALEYANSYKIDKVIFIGDEEVKKRQYKLRDMKTGKEKMLDEKKLLNFLMS